MPFVLRNDQNQICGLFDMRQKPKGSREEFLPEDNSEVQQFRNRPVPQPKDSLTELLVDKGVLTQEEVDKLRGQS